MCLHSCGSPQGGCGRGVPGDSRQMRGLLGADSARARSRLRGTLSTKRCPRASAMKSAAASSVLSSLKACAGCQVQGGAPSLKVLEAVANASHSRTHPNDHAPCP